MMDNYIAMALKAVKTINALEEKIAQEWFGCSYKELDEDSRGEVTAEAYERYEEV